MLLQDHNKLALVSNDEEISYATLIQRVHYYATLFSGGTGKKVAIFSENRTEWIYALYASWKNACTFVPVDFMSVPDDVAHVLNDCKPEVIFCSQGTRETLMKALEVVDHEIQILEFENINVDNATKLGTKLEGINFSDAQDTAVIVYTSGTTGKPKGVMLSFDNALVNISSVCDETNIIHAKQRVMVFLPLHHVYPLMGSVIAPLYIGSTMYFCPSLSPEDLLETLQKYRITLMLNVPLFYNRIAKGVRERIKGNLVAKLLLKTAILADSTKLSKILFRSLHKKFGGHLQYCVCGGAAIDADVVRDLKALGFVLLVGYGTTETAPMITFPRPDGLRLGSSGQPLRYNEIKIVDGEILNRGRNVMQGYYNREKETAELIKDGWMHTGDLGYLDKDNYLFVTGRKKDIIVLSNGKNINPEELENKLINMAPYINEVGVFEKDDALHAAVYFNMGKAKDLGVHNPGETFKRDVLDNFNNSVSPYKRIVRFTVVREELPKTRLSKLRRFMLASLVDTQTRERAAMDEPTTPEYQLLKTFFQDNFEKTPYPSDDLDLDLGLDSLDKVGLQTYVQATFGIELTDKVMLEHPRVVDLAMYIAKNKIKMEEAGIDWGKLLSTDIEFSPPKSTLLHFGKTLSNLLLGLTFRIKVEGLSNLPDTPCIMAPNHQSFLDALFVTMKLKKAMLNKTYFLAKEKHFKQKWRTFFASRYNVIVMDINNDLKTSLQKMASTLKKRNNIIIFPEGTRSSGPDVGMFKKTFAILSREFNVPIVPIAIEGADKAWPRGSIFVRPFKTVRVRYLPPVYPGDHDYESLKNAVQNKIIAELTPA